MRATWKQGAPPLRGCSRIPSAGPGDPRPSPSGTSNPRASAAPAAGAADPATIRIAAGLVLALALLGAALLGSGPAHAVQTEEFLVRPHPPRINGGEMRRTFGFSVTAGEVEDAVRITNLTEDPISLHVYATDTLEGDDGGVNVRRRGEAVQGVAAWISLGSSEVSLAGRRSVVVPFTFRPEGQFAPFTTAAIAVEPAEPQAMGTMDLVTRVAILVRTDALASTLPGEDLESGPGSNDGNGGLPPGGLSVPRWLSLLPIIGFLLLFFLWKRRRRKEEEEQEEVEQAGAYAPRADAPVVLAPVVLAPVASAPVASERPARESVAAAPRAGAVPERESPRVIRRVLTRPASALEPDVPAPVEAGEGASSPVVVPASGPERTSRP